MSEVYYTLVNEDGYVYATTTDADWAIRTLIDFPNDKIIVTTDNLYSFGQTLEIK